MTSYFDELMKMWEKTTDDHVEWLKKRETMTISELLDYVRRLSNETDTFNEKTAHMMNGEAGNHTSIVAAKFKNQYEINRFLASVLLELSTRLVSIPRKLEKQEKSELPLDMKKAIAEEVKREIAKYKKEQMKLLKTKQ